MKIQCSSCKKSHALEEIAWGFTEPHQWGLLNKRERAKSELTSDCCLIETAEGVSFYIRGELLIPIRNTRKHLTLGVWSSLSKSSMSEIMKTWSDPLRVKRGPYFGWLSNAVPFVPDSMYLKASVVQRKPGVRPLIELKRSDHPLSIYQHKGVDKEDLQTILQELIHPQA